jgi:hypothetical protein
MVSIQTRSFASIHEPCVLGGMVVLKGSIGTVENVCSLLRMSEDTSIAVVQSVQSCRKCVQADNVLNRIRVYVCPHLLKSCQYMHGNAHSCSRLTQEQRTVFVSQVHAWVRGQALASHEQ